MKKYRHCKFCEKGTIQYSEKWFCNNKVGIFERCFLGIFSGGVYEACLDKYWVCAECGKYEGE